MKKIITLILIITLLIPPSVLVLAQDDIDIYIDNEQLSSKGTIVNGSTLVPLRAIFETLGAEVA